MALISNQLTHSWVKTVWEKCSAFWIHIEIHNVDLAPPCQGDQWIMDTFAEVGYKEGELGRLDCLHMFQQVLFLSDVIDAGGRYLDVRYYICHQK